VDLSFLAAIRTDELRHVVHALERRAAEAQRPIHVLEVGAGTGWQAKILSEAGWNVEAVDVQGSTYRDERVWPVTEYDGVRLPFEDAAFDVVFSSNVLEHIHDLQKFQAELHRVLAPDGVGLHLVPSAAWRVWTNSTHYPYVARELGAFLRRVAAAGKGVAPTRDVPLEENAVQRALREPRRALVRKLSRALLPPRHGEVGNALSEIWHFTENSWRRRFESTGWKVLERGPSGLFYTGYMLTSGLVPIDVRARMSRLLGSSCHVFLVKPIVGARD
jgi:SAM-dependent methyltransferase